MAILPHSMPDGTAQRRQMSKMMRPSDMPITHQPSKAKDSQKESLRGSSHPCNRARLQSVSPPTAAKTYNASCPAQRLNTKSFDRGEGKFVEGCWLRRGVPTRRVRSEPARSESFGGSIALFDFGFIGDGKWRRERNRISVSDSPTLKLLTRFDDMKFGPFIFLKLFNHGALLSGARFCNTCGNRYDNIFD
jgi:hypothetical protein